MEVEIELQVEVEFEVEVQLAPGRCSRWIRSATPVSLSAPQTQISSVLISRSPHLFSCFLSRELGRLCAEPFRQLAVVFCKPRPLHAGRGRLLSAPFSHPSGLEDNM